MGFRWAASVLATTSLVACRVHFDELADARIEIDAPSEKASCANLAPACGAAGDRDCCDSIAVPGGTYFRTYDVALDGMFADMSNPATVSAFRLDRYEVTLARFRAFVQAGMGTTATPPADGAGAHARISGSGWSPASTAMLPADAAALEASVVCGTFPSWTAGADTSPMNCISWELAAAFCIWDGGYLPTEAEWNFAASGGSEQRAYAWSTPPDDVTIDCTYADYNGCDPGPSTAGSRSPLGDGRWGHSDLAGNVWEWTLDYDGALPVPCDDCVNAVAVTDHVLRGGSIASTSPTLRVSDRLPESVRGDHIGLRCARP